MVRTGANNKRDTPARYTGRKRCKDERNPDDFGQLTVANLNTQQEKGHNILT